jgi:hypothetical protein
MDAPEPLGRPAPAPPAGPPPTLAGTLEPPPPTPPRPPPATAGKRWPAIVAAVLIGAWIVLVTAVLQGLGWLVVEVLIESDLGTPFWLWPVISLVNAGLVGLPVILLAVVPRSPAVRASGQTWAKAAAALGVLGLARAVPVVHNEATLLVQAMLAGGLAALLAGRRIRRGPRIPDGFWLGVAAGLATLVAWLWLGSLGGLTETALAAEAAIAAGALATSVLSGQFWHAYRRQRVAITGLVVAVALVPLAAGVGGSGVHLAELMVLPPLGFAAAALQRRRPGWGRPIAALFGTAAFGPLAFVDPEETFLVLGLRDIGYWTLIAALCSFAVALLTGFGYAVSLRRAVLRGWVAGLVAAVMAMAGLIVYVTVGHPGLHGERLFVVMREQAGFTGLDRRARPVRDRLVEVATRTQAPLRAELKRLHLGFTPYYLVNGIEVDGGPVVRAWLSRRSDVDRVLLSPRLRPLPVPAPTASGPEPAPATPQWNITMLEADRVWRELGVTGAGILVGSSDSGVDGAHPALRNGFRGGDDSWYDPWRHSRFPTDHNGHGTHTLATAVGDTNVGVAPDAKWIGCVNLDRNLGNPARYVDCLQYMLAPFPYGGDPWRDGRPERAAQVLTNSWGCPEIEGCDSGALRQATAALRAAGIFFVAAAGNGGPRCRTVSDPPARYPDVLSVGAVDREDKVASFSSRGPTPDGRTKPDVVAPGVGVLSAKPGGGYSADSGTSMAAPHVAGVVTLMWSANPRLIGDIDRTERILRATAGPATPTGAACGVPQDITGAGLVNAYAAVTAAIHA